MAQFFVLRNALNSIDGSTPMLVRNAVGPSIGLSLHVPNSYSKVIFNGLLTWQQIVWFPMDLNTAYVLEWRLISMDGATQIPISEFEVNRWHNSKRVCVWYFQVWKFQSFLLAKFFISADNCICSHMNFGQTAVEEKLILWCFLVSPRERR